MTTIPVIKLHGTKELRHRSPDDFEPADIFIFVRDVHTVLGRTETFFLNEILELGKPVIILLNKIDAATPEIVDKWLKHIQNLFPRLDVLTVSMKTGENLNKLLRVIIRKMPAACDSNLSATIDQRYKKLVRTQEISLHALITAVHTALLITKRGKIHDTEQLLFNVLGLYFWIVRKYKLSYECLQHVDLGFDAIAHSIHQKKEYVHDYAKPGKGVIVGSTVGLTIVGAIATAGLFTSTTIALPLLPFVIGAPLGGGVLGGLNAMLRRMMVLNMQPELEQLQHVISVTSRFETAVSVFAFGHALSQCCEALRYDSQNNKKASGLEFSGVFQSHYIQASELLAPVKEKLNQLNVKTEQELIQEIVEAVLG